MAAHVRPRVAGADMKALYPDAGIDFLIPLGADAVASELAAEQQPVSQEP